MPKKPTEIFAKKVNPTGVYNQESLIKAILSMRKEINTEQLINGADSGIFETLKDAGFEQGDFLPLYNFNPPSQRFVSFTDTAYAGNNNFSLATVQWDQLFPADAVTHVLAQIFVSSIGAGETVSVRLWNVSDGETAGEITGITSTGVKSISVDYEPTTVGSQIDFRWEWKEDVGTNSSRLDNPFICLGVKI